MTDQDPALSTGALSLTGKQKLRIIVTNGGNGTANDYADWANPLLICTAPPPALAPTDAHQKGNYSPLEPWPTVAVHATLLPDSRIISFYTNDAIGLTRDLTLQ